MFPLHINTIITLYKCVATCFDQLYDHLQAIRTAYNSKSKSETSFRTTLNFTLSLWPEDEDIIGRNT